MCSKKQVNDYIIFLNKQLGQGSFGKIYEIQHQITKTRMAVKMLQKKSIQKNPYMKKAVLQQIRILGSLKSPNIVNLQNVLESSNYFYIVQELCTGGNLREMMGTKGIFTQSQAIDIIKQICNGFIIMLREGVIHRDLKPENILLNNGLMKICDFGFSKKLDNRKAKNNTVVGTPLYKSLQLLKAEPYTGKCDIWALGLIFYQLLHGTTPWTADSQYMLIKNIETKPISILSHLSYNVKSLLRWMLQLQQKDRIGWDELLKHSIFQGQFDSYVALNQSFQNKLKFIMNELRFIITSSNIDLERLFTCGGYNKKDELTLQEFRKFLKVVGLQVSYDESQYAFQKIDIDGSSTISLQQLEITMANHNILVSQKPNSAQLTKANSYDLGQVIDLQQKVNGKLTNAFQLLDNLIIKKKLLLHQVYDQYDVDKDGDLTVSQLGAILSCLDKTFTQEQIVAAFKLIDVSGNSNISYEQFNQFFCRTVGIAVGTLKNQGGQW